MISVDRGGTKPTSALHGFTDIEKLLTKVSLLHSEPVNVLTSLWLIIIPQKPSIQDSEQAINTVLMLKTFLEKVIIIFKALETATGPLLLKVRDLCSPDIVSPPLALIMETVEPNVTYVKSPLELRNQRTFAVKVSRPVFIPTRDSNY